MPAASQTSVMDSCVAPRRDSAAMAPSRMRCRLRPLAPMERCTGASERDDSAARTSRGTGSGLREAGQVLRLGVVARHVHAAIHMNNLAGHVSAGLRAEKYGNGSDVLLGIADATQGIHGGG